MECKLFRKTLDAYLGDTLEENRREIFRHHLRACGACRAWALEADPSLLFAVAVEAPADQDRVESCAAAVTSQIRQQRLRRRLQGRRQAWLALAASALLVIIAALGWRMVGGGGVPSKLATGPAAGAATPPTVEVEMENEGVRVYQFAAEGDSDTAAYFIVNPALEL